MAHLVGLGLHLLDALNLVELRLDLRDGLLALFLDLFSEHADGERRRSGPI